MILNLGTWTSELQAPARGEEGSVGRGSLQDIITNMDEKMKSIAGELERERGKRLELEEGIEQLRRGLCAYGAGVKGGEWEGVGGEVGGRVETELLQLEQRMEQQERQSSTTKVRRWGEERERGKGGREKGQGLRYM